MKIIAISLILVSSLSTFAHEGIKNTDSISKKQSLAFAGMYADSLIEKFDKELDQKLILGDRKSILDENLYAQLLSARDYIENFKDSDSFFTHNKMALPELTDTEAFNKVVNEINKNAEKIADFQRKLKTKSITSNIIYPASNGSGNLTGNTYPKGVWSLTFDDGPRSVRTSTVVDNLYKRNIKATFFMLTEEAKRYASEARNVVSSGMYVGLHSYNHPDLNKATKATLDFQITDAKNQLENLLNIKTRVFRLPYGSGTRNKTVRDLITKNNFVHIFWNIDTLDWKDKDPKSILARTQKQMLLTPNQSGIILFHDIHPQSVIASEYVMDDLIERELKICPVEEVIDHINGQDIDCVK